MSNWNSDRYTNDVQQLLDIPCDGCGLICACECENDGSEFFDAEETEYKVAAGHFALLTPDCTCSDKDDLCPACLENLPF